MAARPAPPRVARPRGRILPTLAALFIAAGVLKALSGVSAALAQDPPPVAPSPAAAPATPAPAIPAALRSSPVSDADLSLQIHERETTVATREAALREREALLAATEDRLRAQITALETAEAELAATMALADQAAETDILRLVSVFEVMKPEDAAAVFGEMDPGFAAGFLARLTPEAAAAILAGLPPRQAYSLSAIVAGRNALVPQE